MSLDPIFSWSLESPDTTTWVPSLVLNGATVDVIWTSGGSTITATPPVFQSLADPDVVWTPSIDNGGIVSYSDGAAAGQKWAALIDPIERRWYFTVDENGVMSVIPLQSFTLDEVALYNTNLSLTRIQAHYNAGSTYSTAVLADSPVGYWRLGEGLIQSLNSWPGRPINVSFNQTSWRSEVQVNTLTIDDTLGQQVTASFTVVNPSITPQIGDVVKITWYDYVLFAGTVDSVRRTFNKPGTVYWYECSCVDWSQSLIRRKVQRNFKDITIQSLVDDLLDNELANEGFTMGTVDSRATIPLIDSQQGRAFDIFRDAGGVTGQTFFVGFDKTIQFRSSSVNNAPTNLVPSTAQAIDLEEDRETYRNVQTVIAEGTPQTDGEDALTAQKTEENTSQIAARQAIEGGTGRYEEIEKLTHPTSNDGADLALLALGYARLRLATSGTIRKTLKVTVRGWGFRAGQVIDVNIPRANAVGEWVIQRASLVEEDGHSLIYNLELTQSSLQRRAYESWLSIVQQGKVTVVMPGSITSNNLVTFDNQGTFQWVVPSGIGTVEITAYGPGGGAGGWWYGVFDTYTASGPGGKGGNGGKAIKILTVTPGQILDIVVGTVGTHGSNVIWPGPPITAGNGTAGTHSSVSVSGLIVCQGNGGGGGEGNNVELTGVQPADGTPGDGIGDARSIGGGPTGGTSVPLTNGELLPVGGSVEIRY